VLLICSRSSQSTARIAICYPHACFVQYIHEKSPVVSLTSQTIPFLVAFYPCRIIRAQVFILSDLDADANNNSSSRSLSLLLIYNHFPVSCCSKYPRSVCKMSNPNHHVYLPVNANRIEVLFIKILPVQSARVDTEVSIGSDPTYRVVMSACFRGESLLGVFSPLIHHVHLQFTRSVYKHLTIYPP